jgi:hypothetical protein
LDQRTGVIDVPIPLGTENHAERPNHRNCMSVSPNVEMRPLRNV